MPCHAMSGWLFRSSGACATGPGGESGLAGFWSAAGDALLMFPLSRTVRESLVQLACASMAQQGPAAASIRGSQGLQMRPQEGATITSAPVVGILLQLLLGCDDAAERNATLEALHCLIGVLSSTHLQTCSAADGAVLCGWTTQKCCVYLCRLRAQSSNASQGYPASPAWLCKCPCLGRDCWYTCAAVEGPKENRAVIVSEEGWEEWLLELLLDGSPCIPSAEDQASLDSSLRSKPQSLARKPCMYDTTAASSCSQYWHTITVVLDLEQNLATSLQACMDASLQEATCPTAQSLYTVSTSEGVKRQPCRKAASYATCKRSCCQ